MASYVANVLSSGIFAAAYYLAVKRSLEVSPCKVLVFQNVQRPSRVPGQCLDPLVGTLVSCMHRKPLTGLSCMFRRAGGLHT